MIPEESRPRTNLQCVPVTQQTPARLISCRFPYLSKPAIATCHEWHHDRKTCLHCVEYKSMPVPYSLFYTNKNTPNNQRRYSKTPGH